MDRSFKKKAWTLFTIMIMTTTVYMASAIWSPAVTIGAEHFGVSELVSTLGITTFGRSKFCHDENLGLTSSGRLRSWSTLPIAHIGGTLHWQDNTLHHLPTPILRLTTPNSGLQSHCPIPRPSIPSGIRR